LDPTLLVSPAIAFALTAIALKVVIGRVGLPLDRPNERSLHSHPVPRAGGFALVPAMLVAWSLAPVWPHWSLWLAVSGLFAISALDDVRGLPVGVRFSAHLAAAALVVSTLVGTTHGIALAVVLTLACAWMINLYNFMDGSDGLAGGMASIGFGSYALGAWLGGDAALATVCACVAAAAAGFLLFNFPPARVFLGDAGSIPLGLLAGALGLAGWNRGLWPIWFPALVFSPFVVDASVTLARRLARGERIWQAHREHYYQRLVRLGWGHRNTALAEYALMIFCGGLALAAIGRTAATQALIGAVAAAAYLVLMLGVDAGWKRRAPQA